MRKIQVSQLYVDFFYPQRDNITEKVEKIIFGKFVSVTFALVFKKQLKQHTGGHSLSDGCYFLQEFFSATWHKKIQDRKKVFKKRKLKWKNVEIL